MHPKGRDPVARTRPREGIHLLTHPTRIIRAPMSRRTLLSLFFLLAPALAPAQQLIEFRAGIAPSPARAGERVVLTVTGKVTPGYHVYGAKETGSIPISLTLNDTAGLKAAGAPEIPDGHLDKGMGIDQWVIDGTFTLKQSLDVPAGTKAGALKVKMTVPYMACDDNHCEPPAEETLFATVTVEDGAARKEFAIPSESGGTTSKPSSAKTSESKPTPPAKGAAGTDSTSGSGGDDGLLAFLLLAVGWGLFTLAMPCTYPMIPITITFFTKQASARGGSVFPLAMTYGIGIVAMFVLIGVIVGDPIITVAQHWVSQLVIGLAFIVFALSLFGVITLQPPQALLNLAGKASRRGGYGGVFLMGFFFVVTSFTCTAPFVANLLSVGANSGSVGRIALGMAVFGLTMAVPFALLALLPGRLQALPRAGEWMHVLKVTLGFIELAAALKFLSTVDMQFQLELLPRELFLWLWTIIFGIAGIYLLGVVRLHGDNAEGVRPLRMTNGVLMLLVATYFGFGASGNRLDSLIEPLMPDYHAHSLIASAPSKSAGAAEPTVGALLVVDDLEKARALASEKRRWLLVNFTGFG